MGTGDISVPALRWLLEESGRQVVGVVCQPDKPAGRKMLLTAPETKTLALAHGVPVLQPEKIGAAAEALRALRPDLSVVMAYGQFLPKAVRELAPLGCINLHASLLPRWRGASPVHSALLAGDAVTGVTVMHVAREMDAGDTILAERTDISPTDTGQTLHDRLAELAAVALARALPLLEAGTAPRMPQEATQVTACAKLTRGEGRLDWREPAAALDRRIRAFDPWPGTHTVLPDGRTLKIFPPVSRADGSGAPGEVISTGKDRFTVACGEGGALEIFHVQPEGQRRMTAQDFLPGRAVAAGMRLG